MSPSLRRAARTSFLVAARRLSPAQSAQRERQITAAALCSVLCARVLLGFLWLAYTVSITRTLTAATWRYSYIVCLCPVCVAGSSGGVSCSVTVTGASTSSPTATTAAAAAASAAAAAAAVAVAGGSRQKPSRRNAWGNQSYADLITQAIEAAPEKRLTLAQIYDWMVQNVAYFRDKGDMNSSAGWKVCVACACACARVHSVPPIAHYLLFASLARYTPRRAAPRTRLT